jgi:hypothetical protein
MEIFLSEIYQDAKALPMERSGMAMIYPAALTKNPGEEMIFRHS